MNIVMLRRLVLDSSMSGIMLLPLFVVFFASFRQVWLFAGKLSLRTNHAARGLRLFVQVTFIIVRVYPFNFDFVVVRSVVFFIYQFQCLRQVFGVMVNI